MCEIRDTRKIHKMHDAVSQKFVANAPSVQEWN